MNDLDAHFAQLELLTRRAADKWRDILTLPEPYRSQTLAMWGEDDWVQNPDVFAEVVSVVTILVSIAGAVSGLAGAASAVAALRSGL